MSRCKAAILALTLLYLYSKYSAFSHTCGVKRVKELYLLQLYFTARGILYSLTASKGALLAVATKESNFCVERGVKRGKELFLL